MKTKLTAISATSDLPPKQAAFLAAAVRDGIQIQPRFRPEPRLARTGRGFMAPAGVAEIAAAIRSAAARK